MHDNEITSSSIAVVPGLTHKALQAMTTVLAILVVGLLFLAAIYLRQDRMLYFPAPAPATATVAGVAGSGLQAWPSAQDFRGLVAEPAGPARGTAIVFHGNAAGVLR